MRILATRSQSYEPATRTVFSLPIIDDRPHYLRQEGYVFAFVYLSVCPQDKRKCYRQILMSF